ncbi:MAG: hypothetical protein KF784_10505 [Fimbriimonadaceae bacterium]|nr:hypothetical protein [Fimbriimonadaceae bacterium]
MNTKWLLSAVAAFTLVTGFSCTEPSSQGTTGTSEASTGRSFGEPSLAVTLQDKAINESSGIAPSYLKPDWYLTHNDSGDTARFWRFDLKGTIEGPFNIKGAGAVDWEDMASASLDGKNYVYLADIGDNSSRRASVQIYRVEEPSGSGGDISAFEKWDLKYPDGAHNAESFMVHPKTGDMYIVTKVSAGDWQVFKLDGSSGPGSHTLKEIGKITPSGAMEASRLTTAGDISPDGKYVMVRTYSGGFEFAAPANFDDWFKAKPVPVKLNVEMQGEAICYALDGKKILTTSEFTPCRVSVVPVR